LKIAVCLKHVPSTETRVQIAPDGRHLDPAGVSYVINPYDEFALEEALRIKEKSGGEIAVFTVGGPGVVASLRNALALGADRAVHLRTEADLDGAGVAAVLAGALAGQGFDLILCGKQAVDDDAGVVGPMLAQRLGVPCATVVVSLSVEGGAATVRREVEGGLETVTFSLPAVVAAQKGLNEPRYASLKGIMAAKKKPIEEQDVEAPAPAVEVVGLELPPARSAGRIVGHGPEAVEELVRVLREEAKVL
jgi:electron transfer flavoprotein beta subunit